MKLLDIQGVMVVILLLGTMAVAQEAPTLDSELVAVLKEILNEDQQSRELLMNIMEQKGKDSQEFKAQTKRVSFLDSLHSMVITDLLDDKGWLGPDVIGEEGNTTLFLVLQHTDLKTQKKYLPMLEEAVLGGNAEPSFAAMLTDRIAVLEGKKQWYGSQLNTNEATGDFFVYPIKDPETVDQRRAAVGLGTLEKYLAMFGLQWDLEAHKAQVADFDNKNKH